MYAALVLIPLLAAVAAGQKYTTKYDNIDVDKILNNDRLLNNYFNCVMDKGKCTPEGKELKKNIPDGLENDCANCSEKQKKDSDKVLKFVFEKKPDMYKEIEAKYDPQGKYRIKLNKLKERLGKA